MLLNAVALGMVKSAIHDMIFVFETQLGCKLRHGRSRIS